jgi:aminopeptidase N
VDHVRQQPQDLGLPAGPAAEHASDRGAAGHGQRGAGQPGRDQLAAFVGREQFFAGLRAYFAEHAWGNTELADLLGALERSSGRDLAGWSHAWLESAGPNTLAPQFELDDAGAYASFAVRQSPSQHGGALRPHRIAIGLYAFDAPGGALRRVRRIEVDVDGPLTAVPELAGTAQPDLVLLNDDDLTYALLRFDPRSLATLTGSLGALEDSLARAVCWTSLADMVEQAELALPVFMQAAVSAMASETSLPVLRNLHEFIAYAVHHLSDAQEAAQLRAALADAARELLEDAQPGSDHQLTWAQLFARSATTEAQLDLLAGLFDGGRAVPGLEVDTDLRWTMLQRLAATDRAGDAAIDAELQRDPTDAGRKEADAARAAIPDAAHKESAWRMLTEGADLDVHTIRKVALAFSAPEHSELVAPYAERYFTEMPQIWHERSPFVRSALADRLFPTAAAAGPQLPARADALLAEHGDEPALARALIEGRDLAERALRCRRPAGVSAPAWAHTPAPDRAGA